MLTDTVIRQIKPGHSPRKLSDGHGLFLLVQSNGSKLWRQAYRFGGKQRLLAHGRYPQISLSDARRASEAARALLREGTDPSSQRRLAKAVTGNTFRHVAEEILAKSEKEGKSANTLRRNKWILRRVYPAIGDRPVSEITAPELLAVCREVETAELYETACRLRSICSAVFRSKTA